MNLFEQIREIVREEVRTYLAGMLKPEKPTQPIKAPAIQIKLESTSCPHSDPTCKKSRGGKRCGPFYCPIPGCGEKGSGTICSNACISCFRRLGKEGVEPHRQAWWTTHNTQQHKGQNNG